MNEQASIVRTGRKFDQVLEGAREVFMADGFEGASVDDIARAAGVAFTHASGFILLAAGVHCREGRQV